MNEPHVDREHALKILLELLAIDGGSCHEGAVRAFIERRLSAAGVPDQALFDDGANQRSPLGGECGNLIAHLGGNRAGAHRVLMAHMDTVPLCANARPVISGDTIVAEDPRMALGGDDRAGCAVLLYVAEILLRLEGDHPPVTLLFTVQEEIGLLGARYLDPSMLQGAAFAVNFDGGRACRIARGATGAYRIATTIRGKAAHAGAHPEDGVSALIVAAAAATDLWKQGLHGLVERDGLRATVNIGSIRGGDATNVVCPDIVLESEIRAHDRAFRDGILASYQEAFARAAASLTSIKGDVATVTHEVELGYESFTLQADHEIVRATAGIMRSRGLTPEVVVSNGGLDANWMVTHGIPTVTVGVGQDQIHSPGEKVLIPEFLSACDFAVEVARCDHHLYANQ